MNSSIKEEEKNYQQWKKDTEKNDTNKKGHQATKEEIEKTKCEVLEDLVKKDEQEKKGILKNL